MTVTEIQGRLDYLYRLLEEAEDDAKLANAFASRLKMQIGQLEGQLRNARMADTNTA